MKTLSWITPLFASILGGRKEGRKEKEVISFTSYSWVSHTARIPVRPTVPPLLTASESAPAAPKTKRCPTWKKANPGGSLGPSPVSCVRTSVPRTLAHSLRGFAGRPRKYSWWLINSVATARGSAKGFPPHLWAFLIPKEERERYCGILVRHTPNPSLLRFQSLTNKIGVPWRGPVAEVCWEGKGRWHGKGFLLEGILEQSWFMNRNFPNAKIRKCACVKCGECVCVFVWGAGWEGREERGKGTSCAWHESVTWQSTLYQNSLLGLQPPDLDLFPSSDQQLTFSYRLQLRCHFLQETLFDTSIPE